MARLWILAILGPWIVVCTSSQQVFAQGQASFEIFIPLKVVFGGVPAPFPQIGAVRARFSVATSSDVTIKVTDVNNVPQSFVAINPTSTSTQTLSFPAAGGSNADTITLWAIPDTNDPNRYEMEFKLRRDSASSCSGTQTTNTNTYTVQVTAGPLITGVCLESRDGYSRTGTAPSCTNTNLDAYQIPVPLDDPSDFVATLKNPPTSNQPTATDGCFTQRPPVDVFMVLDKSGSMNASAPSNGPTRMDALHKAVRNFVNVWSGLPPTSGDKIGAVFFDTTSPTQPAIPNFPLPLTDMTLTTTSTNVPDWVDTVTPGGSTSIAAGLHQADQGFVSDGHRKVILLMSDGQQNTDPFVKGDGGLYCTSATDPLCIAQSLQACTLGGPCPLSNHPKLYTVTVGPSGSVDPAIAQAIATGFYLNTEDPPYPLLSPFFLELLQNFLRFNSYETARITSGSTPYLASTPISTTSLNAVFSLMWTNQALLRLTITPPGGAQPIIRQSGSGFISVVQQLPLPAPFDPMGDWNIKVEAVDLDTGAAATTTMTGGVPFDMHVMTDDEGIKTDLAIVPGDYKPGDNIRLRAKLTRFGLPILGLGSHPGNKIEAALIRPGKSIGDILSESTESANPSGTDPQSPAEAKLDNTLRKDASKLKRESAPSVMLYDDGKPEHGDDVAGDGIYNALYPSTLPGHYNFTLAAETLAPDSVRFSRQQLRTVYVRPFPDADKTELQSSTHFGRNGAKNTLSIVMTPRTKAGDHMGPGWANYFWFTTPGQTPFKAIDNLNGTYTATLAFTGSNPPPVSVHFENVLAVIGDSVTPDHLPAPVGPDNVFTDVPPPPGGTGKFAVFFDAGTGIPHGTFGNFFNTGFSLNTGLEYIATSHFSVEGIFGYHRFPAKIAGDLNLYQFSVNGKAYLTSGTLRPFVNGGVGAYKFSPGPTKFGGNIGGGVLYSLTSRVGLEGAYNFHVINTPGAATKFSTFQGGIRFVF